MLLLRCPEPGVKILVKLASLQKEIWIFQ